LTRDTKNTGDTCGVTLNVNWINDADQVISSRRIPSSSWRNWCEGTLGNVDDDGQPDQV